MIKKILLLLGLSLLSINSFAGGLGLSPMRMELKQCTDIGSFIASNSSDNFKQIHIQTRRWTQVNGKDIYGSANNLLVTPPMFAIQPHSKQIIRVGLRQCDVSNIEQAYRITVRETKSTVTNKHTKQLNGVSFLFGFDVPIYIEPKQIAHAYTWQAKKLKQGIALQLVNRGNVRVAVYSLKVVNANGKQIQFDLTGVPTALAGSTIAYATLKTSVASSTLKISGTTNWDDFSQTLHY